MHFLHFGVACLFTRVSAWTIIISCLVCVVGRSLLAHPNSSRGRGRAALLCGLRVRMGMATGLTEQGVHLHQVTKRRLYPGAVSRRAHAVSEIGAGGQVRHFSRGEWFDLYVAVCAPPIAVHVL